MLSECRRVRLPQALQHGALGDALQRRYPLRTQE
jgi:hypothetical protein